MSLSTERILEDVLSLPEDQRAELAVRLLQSLDREIDPDAEEAWATEIERRCRCGRRWRDYPLRLARCTSAY